MSENQQNGSQPTVVLVHGAFAESASWNDVIRRLQVQGYTTVGAANPLRSVSGDAEFVASVLEALEGPIVLVGHSYGGTDLYIRQEEYHQQFAADVPTEQAALMAASQRPIRDVALNEGSGTPAWRSIPSWFVFGELDKNVPVAALRFMAERAGGREVVEIEGASHAVGVSRPGAVADLI